MTRQEAIEVLIKKAHCFHGEEVKVLRMAIKTLQHEQERQEDIYECPNCIGEVHINYIYCPFCGIKVGE